MSMSHLFAGFVEVLFLRDAERRATALDETRRSEMVERAAAARLRLRASRRLTHPVPALELLRSAHVHAARAAELMGTTPPDPLEPVSELEIDRGSLEENETRREALDAKIAALLGSLELRTPIALRATRIARLVAIGLLIALVGSHFARSRLGERNLALGKPVSPSSIRLNPPNPAELVDGRTQGTIGIHTNDEPAPQIVIDLEAVHAIHTIKVYNRGDGWFDDSLPLLVDTSTDGVTYDPVARRTNHFDVWSMDAGGRAARYVRIRRSDPGYIALNEVEVFGR